MIDRIGSKKLNDYLLLCKEDWEIEQNVEVILEGLLDDTGISEELYWKDAPIMDEFSKMSFEEILEKGLRNEEIKKEWNRTRIPLLFQ